MYEPNPLSKFSSWLASNFDRWTNLHLIAGACIGFVFQHFTSFDNVSILLLTLGIAVAWEIFERYDYTTVQEMYKDYGGKAGYWKNTIIDVIAAMFMSWLVIT